MFATLPGWFLNGDGVASVTFAQPASVGNLCGILSVLTVVALALILGQGRWRWQSSRAGATTRKRKAKGSWAVRAWLPSDEFTVARR